MTRRPSPPAGARRGAPEPPRAEGRLSPRDPATAAPGTRAAALDGFPTSPSLRRVARRGLSLRRPLSLPWSRAGPAFAHLAETFPPADSGRLGKGRPDPPELR